MRRYQDIDVAGNPRIEVVGETNEVGGGKFEGDGASEHGPKSKKHNRTYEPELVVPLADKNIIGALSLCDGGSS